MAKFVKCRRDAKLFLHKQWLNWRLASVDEVMDNLPILRRLENLKSWDTVRLLDGCWEINRAIKQYRPNMDDMILIETDESRQEDGKSYRPAMYSRVNLHEKGGNAALLLACEDKITEAICFVLDRMVSVESVPKSPVDGDSENSRMESPAKISSNVHGSSNVDRSSPKHGKEKNTSQTIKPGELSVKDKRSLTKLLKEEFDCGRKLLQCAADQQSNNKHFVAIVGFLMDIFKEEEGLLKDKDIFGRTILHFAALAGNVDICQRIIDQRQMVADERDINQENVLHFAVKGKNEAVLEYLCKMDQLQGIIGSGDAQGRTALHKAAAQGAEKMIGTLLASISMSPAELQNSQANLLEHEELGLCAKERAQLIFIRRPDVFGQTALLDAARGGHVSVVKILLTSGSRPLRERNSDGRSALHYAAQLTIYQNAIEMAKSLLDKCGSEVEKSLLLWAYAIGSGTAEESAKTPEAKNFLKKERGSLAGSSKDLLTSAIELKYEKIAWELVNRGAATAQIKEGKWTGEGKQRVDNLREHIGNLKKMPERGREQPALYDTLERKEFAQGLAALFLNPYVKPPLTVGIFGDWGMGKSSLMIQTESILLKTASQLAFPNLIQTEQFPGCRQIELSRKGKRHYKEMSKAVKNIQSSSSSIDDPLLEFLDSEYREEYYRVYKSLALVDRSEMIEMKGGEEEADPGSYHYALRKIPSILTVRYNAWRYHDESQAWAGLAVETTKAIEESMTTAQRVRCHCRYAWGKNRNKIWLELFLPFVFTLFLSGWIAWLMWTLISRSKNNELVHLTYGSIPITILVAVWTVLKQFLSVIKPISAQVMGYFSKTDHSANLGYQHEVISDISFLIDEIAEKPSCKWKLVGCLCNLLHLYSEPSHTIKGASIRKSPAPAKDDIRMIVFVDDLDRCDETVILKVLSAIHLVLATCNINVVLGMDEKMLARAMQTKFPGSPKDAEELAKKYLSKIVQLPLVLPDTSHKETMKFLHEQLGHAFEESGSKVHGEAQIVESARDNQSQSGQHPDHVVEVRSDLPQKRQRFLTKICRIFEPFRGFKFCLLQGWEQAENKTKKRKLETMTLNIQMILPNYTPEERNALDQLSKEATGDQRLPREWKRFLIYHRVAWNILSQSEQVKEIPGWQTQLVVWVFCCWQWEKQINDIIQNWKKLVIVNSFIEDGENSLELAQRSLKSIVENKYNEVTSPTKTDDKDKDEEKGEVDEEKADPEREAWESLLKALDTYTYDVCMKGILSFQKFRLHCKIGHLYSATDNLTRKDKGVHM